MQRVASLLCLLAFLCGASGALPELCALVASFDRSHSPIVGARDAGLVLILSHAKNRTNAASTTPHRHGVVARGLCLLANQNPTQTDHRLEFAPGGVSEISQSSFKLAARSAGADSIFNCLALSAVPSVNTSGFWTHAPPCSPDSLLSTRFTVLLV
jgi:hypothetical protein